MADFYGTPAGFKAYAQARGRFDLFAMEDADITVALLVASEWLDGAFMSDFDGLKTGQRDQVREWPRSSVVDVNGYSVASGIVPREIENATYEAAGRQLTTPGIFFKDYSPSKYKSVNISGAIAVEYATGSAYDFQTQFPAIAAILYPLIGGAVHGDMSSLSGGIMRV